MVFSTNTGKKRQGVNKTNVCYATNRGLVIAVLITFLDLPCGAGSVNDDFIYEEEIRCSIIAIN